MSFLSVEKISAGYGGHPILADVSFQLEQGCMMGILGANGCGKTTLLKVILGLLKPYSGEVIYPVSRQNLFGYLPQNSRFDQRFPIDVTEVVLSGLMSEKGLNLILKDRRVLHLLYEHKFVMEQRLEYLAYFENHNAKIRKCFEDYNDIVGSALNIRNLALKYQINGDEKIRNKIFNSLKEMMDKEKKILSEVVGLLS